MREGAQVFLSLLLYAAGALALGWLTLRFLLPWAAPFLLALALAAVLERPVRFLERRGWRRSLAAGLLSLLLLAAVVWLAVWLISRGVAAATDFARQTPLLIQGMSRGLEALEARVLAAIATAPESLADYLETALEALGRKLYDLPSLLSRRALDALTRAAQASPDVLLFAVTVGIGTYFFSAGFPRVLAFAAAQIPADWRRRCAGLGRDLKDSCSGYLRAQLILMAMTFFELLLGFLLLKIPGAAGLAALTALIDALPVFGAGAVLVPWALYSLLLGELRRGLGLLICWGLVYLLRSCTQAKLLGDQIGLDPLASLIAIYVGWRVARVGGMLLFPLLLVTLQQLNEKGVLHLWKTP